MTRLQIFLERNRAKQADALLYFVLIPFLRPRGFDEVSGLYKGFFTLWLYAAMLLIVAVVIHDFLTQGLHYKPCAYAVAGYYILFVLITLIQQRGIHEGTQKMFAAPALYLFSMVSLKNEPRKYLLAVVNILTVEFALGLTILCPFVTKYLIGIYHVNFLGHVQVAAQYGILGCFAAFLLTKMDARKKRRSILLVVLSLLQTIWAGTAAGALMLGVLVLGIYLRSRPDLRKLTLLNPQYYYLGYVALNAIMLVYSFTGLDMALGINLDFSGRTLIWRECFKLILKHPILGYGAYGVEVVVPWSDGMNYAHNEFVQRLMDGGIVLCVAYIVMLYTFVQAAQQIRNKRVLSVVNVCMTALLVVMLFESVTDYFFVAFFFTLMAYTPEILQYKRLSRYGGE